jgi:[ribosomal protein S5]-alanine N-acetyltransferase
MKFLLDGCETERLLFRLVHPEDAEAWLDFMSKEEAIWFLALRPEDSPQERCRKWFARIEERYANNLGGMNALVERKTGSLIGQAGLLVQHVDGVCELEVAYSILPDYWNNGYASEAARACRDVAFQRQFSDSLISIIHLENFASQQVADRNGMNVDKQTLFREMPVLIYRITLKEWQSDHKK